MVEEQCLFFISQPAFILVCINTLNYDLPLVLCVTYQREEVETPY